MPIALKPAHMLGGYIRCKRAPRLHPPRVSFGKKRDMIAISSAILPLDDIGAHKIMPFNARAAERKDSVKMAPP